MKLRSLTFAFGALALATVSSAQFAAGNLVINQVGTGAAALTNAAAPINFIEFANNGTGVLGSALRTVTVASAGADAITQSGSATSEGGISGIHGGNGLYFVGYAADAGTTGVVGSAAARRVGRLDYATGQVSYTTLDANTYGGNNLRYASGYTTSGVPGSNFITAGTAATGGGARTGTFGNGTTTLASDTLTNTRVSLAYEGNFYASASSGTFLGVAQLSATGAPTLLLGDGTGSSAYDFQFFDGGNVAYVIDDRAAGATANVGGGLQKFVRQANGSYTKVYTVALGTVGGRQFTATNVDANGNVTFYAVGTNNQLYAFNDSVLAGSTTTSAVATSIYTAPANTALRGVEVVPEPASMAAMALGLGALISRRKRKSA